MAENTTSRLALPYPSATGLVKNGATNFEELAKKLDELIPVRKSSIIATEQSRESTNFGTLATPDEVEITLLEKSLLEVTFWAMWKNSISGNGYAAIFLNNEQVHVAEQGAGPAPERSARIFGKSTSFVPLFSTPMGLASVESEEGMNTTEIPGINGKAIFVGLIGKAGLEGTETKAAVNTGGTAVIYAEPGTYKVSIRYKSITGTITAKNRHLWVEAKQF